MNAPTPDFDTLLAEQRQLDSLVEKGMSFTVEKQSLLRFIGKPNRTFFIKEPYLGTLDRLSTELVNLNFSEEALKQDWLAEGKRLMSLNAKRTARIVAIAVLNSRWGMHLVPILTHYLLWRVTPKKLYQLTMIIIQISNLWDFTNSIRYLAVDVNRTTNPALMEKPSPEASAVLSDQEEPS